jgi:hypothetical protein
MPSLRLRRTFRRPCTRTARLWIRLVRARSCAGLTAAIGHDVESRAGLVDDFVREAREHIALDVPIVSGGTTAVGLGTYHLRPLPPLRTSSTATCCLSKVRSEKSWKRHLPPSHELIVWMYASPSERGPEKHSWKTTMAGEPGGPAVMMMLVYSVRGEPLMQSRTWRRRDGVVVLSNRLRVSLPFDSDKGLHGAH